MDKIQKKLIELGHKDLAQEYYRKVAIFEPRQIVSFEVLLDEALDYLDSGVGKLDTAYNLERNHKIPKVHAKMIVDKAIKLFKKRGPRFDD